MHDSDTSVQTTLRIPGNWAHPGELIERMPTGFRITPESLFLPDGTEIELIPMPPDDRFAEIFASSCRRPAASDELAKVRNYTVNIALCGPGGSLSATEKMMQAGAAIIRAGGAGVFIDNSGISHGGSDWIEMTEDATSDALSFAFVSIIQGQHEVWTMGMHVLGYPEFVMRRSDADAHEDAIIDVVRYVCRGDKPIGDGHLLADEQSLRFQAVATPNEKFSPGRPMYNPFGRLKLVSIRDLGEAN